MRSRIDKSRSATRKKSASQLMQRLMWILGLSFLMIGLWIGLASSFTSQPLACIDDSESEAGIYKTNPKEIVIEPWLGEHNVYALFVIPKKYSANLNESEAIVKVNGVESTVDATGAKPSLYKQVEVPEGNLLLVSYLWTRETIWQILQGKYSQLNYSCNWTLYIRL